MSLSYITIFRSKKDAQVTAKVYLNEDTGFYEVYYYDSVVKEEPPVGLFKFFTDACEAGNTWCE